ncbi:MAG: phosphoribosyltransferase family protein [Caldilineales bacterium]|nr:phosphoribosyltransferase family protein [Caldilineales bacterium]MDW8317016.1 phosphoribosyltransferase family protein [Anaerolineae bacterium]
MRTEVLTWADVDRLIEELIPQFRGTYDALLMITRGGIIPGGLLAEALDIKYILTAAVEFHSGVQKRLAWPTFLQFPGDALLRGRRVLVVDDVWGSGRTIMTVRSRVQAADATPELAVLHYKPGQSMFRDAAPEYYAAVTDAYIVYPWEVDRRADRELTAAGLG